MTRNGSYRIGPVMMMGNRLIVAITKQVLVHWGAGAVATCSPVALVAIEDGGCLLWKLDEPVPVEEIRGVLQGIEQTAFHGSQGP